MLNWWNLCKGGDCDGTKEVTDLKKNDWKLRKLTGLVERVNVKEERQI